MDSFTVGRNSKGLLFSTIGGSVYTAKKNIFLSLCQSPQPKPVGRKNSSVEESWEEEKARRDAEEKEREEQASKEEKEKASLVASFFGGTASKPATSKPVAKVANRAPVKVVERASFTPNAGTEIQVISTYDNHHIHPKSDNNPPGR